MITQEIKLYEESTPYVYTAPTTSYKSGLTYISDDIPSIEEFEKHLKMAKEKHQIGQRYRYKTSAAMIEIIGFESDRRQAAIYAEDPGVIQGKRVALAGEYAPVYNYSIAELEEMEEVK